MEKYKEKPLIKFTFNNIFSLESDSSREFVISNSKEFSCGWVK